MSFGFAFSFMLGSLLVISTTECNIKNFRVQLRQNTAIWRDVGILVSFSFYWFRHLDGMQLNGNTKFFDNYVQRFEFLCNL